MLWIGSSLGWVVLALFTVDWRRLVELLPGALVGVLYLSVHTTVGIVQPFLTVSNGGLPISPWIAVLIGQVTAFPTLALLYAQGLKPCKGPPLWRTAAFTAVLAGMALFCRWAGLAVYAPWWPPLMTLFDALAFFLLVWLVQHYSYACGSPLRIRGRTSERPR